MILFDMFGLNRLKYYSEDERYILYNIILNMIIHIDVNTKITSKDYIKMEKYLLMITNFLIKNCNDLFLNKNNIDMVLSGMICDTNKRLNQNYPSLNISNISNKISEGLYGKIYKYNGNIYKTESMRYKGEMENKKKVYPVYNYLSSQILINFIIQNYLNSLNNNYVPAALNLLYGYNKKENNIISITKMEHIFKNENNINKNKTYVLYDFIKKESERPTFIKDFFYIMKKICEILIFYQDSCGFVHYDFHIGNISVLYSYDKDGNFEYDKVKVKMIDFGESSIIFNINNNSYLLQYYNPKNKYNPNYRNPYKSKLWYIIDLFMFINRCVIYFRDQNVKKILNNIKQEFINIFNFNENCLELFDNKFNELLLKKTKDFNKSKFHQLLLYNIKLRNEIYGKNANYELFNPRLLIKYIDEKFNFN